MTIILLWNVHGNYECEWFTTQNSSASDFEILWVITFDTSIKVHIQKASLVGNTTVVRTDKKCTQTNSALPWFIHHLVPRCRYQQVFIPNVYLNKRNNALLAIVLMTAPEPVDVTQFHGPKISTPGRSGTTRGGAGQLGQTTNVHTGQHKTAS